MRDRIKELMRHCLLVFAVAPMWAAPILPAQTNGATGTVASVIVTNTSVVETTPAWIDQLDRNFPVLEYRLWGNEVWKYWAALIYILLAFYTATLIDYLTRVWLRKYVERNKVALDQVLVDVLNGPVKVVVFVLFLHLGLGVLQWSPKAESVINKGFTIAVALTVTYMVIKFVDLGISIWRRRAQGSTNRAFDDQFVRMASKSAKAFILVVAVLLTCDNLNIKITSLLAGVSIGGLAIGLAAQDTLANLFGAISVFADKSFTIGEVIRLDTMEGTVQSIGMRSTRLRNTAGALVTIPNKTIANATIINLSRRPTVQTDFSLALPYHTPAAKVKRAVAILGEVYRANPKTISVAVTFDKFGSSALNVAVSHVWNGPDDSALLAAKQAFNLAIKEKFEAEGVELACPGQTIYLKTDASAAAVGAKSATSPQYRPQ